MDLSIIIVNWNSVDYLQKCLTRIVQNVSGLEYEVIIIDNASYDGSEEMIGKDFPQFIFLQSLVNLGFARANNLAFAKSQGDVVLFLNPDTEIIGDAIQQMYGFLKSCDNAGAVGCKLLNTDKTIQTNCILPLPNLLNELLDIEFLRRNFYQIPLWGTKSLYTTINHPVPVDVINGACIMIKREVFIEIGLFSLDYFMYSEDVDLGYKIKYANYKSYFIPTVSIIHHGGKSTLTKKNTSFSNVLMRESRMIYFQKTKGFIYAKFYRIMMLINSIIRIIMIFMIFPINLLYPRFKDLSISIYKWKKIFMWALGMEKWTKKVSGF